MTVATNKNNKAQPKNMSRALKILREDGFRTFCMRVLGELGYRRMFVFARELDKPILDLSARIPIMIDLLTRQEVPEYAAFRVEAEEDEVLERFDDGHLCFVARHEGRIVHTAWVSEKYAYTTYLRLPIPMMPGDVYLYDSFTHPDYRGLNISPARTIYMLRFMHQAGYKRLVSATLPDNYRSRRDFEKTGFYIFALIGYVKICAWRREFCRYVNRTRP